MIKRVFIGLSLLLLSINGLLFSASAQAFYFVQLNQTLGQADDQAPGWNLGYHSENIDFFWRAHIGYQRPDKHSERWNLNADWVLPIPGTYSTAFIGAHHIINAGHSATQLYPHAGIS